MADQAQEIHDAIRSTLAPNGLLPFGWFSAEDGRPALLIGNIGSSLWPAFSKSAEYLDDQADSMDRWTVNRIDPVANEFGAEARYPFGTTIWPFQQYAKAATGMRQSPIGLLIHPQFGLWSAFRAVLVFAERFEIPAEEAIEHPCDSCLEKPCLSTCPISAFKPEGFDYMACRAHVGSEQGSRCRKGGCLARQSCPIGEENSYENAHQAFHMNAYI